MRFVCFASQFIYLGFYVAVQVISRRVVGRAEETSTYSLLGFCTVNCRPMASNYQLSHLRPCRGSNPGLRGGRRECYYSATVAPFCLSSDRIYKYAVRELYYFYYSTKINLIKGMFKTIGLFSNLNFISKILESVVASQHQSHLDKAGRIDNFDCVYRKPHSTKSAPHKIQKDLLNRVNGCYGSYSPRSFCSFLFYWPHSPPGKFLYMLWYK